MDTRIALAAVSGLLVGAVGVSSSYTGTVLSSYSDSEDAASVVRSAQEVSYAGNYFGKRAARARHGKDMLSVGTRGTNYIGGAPGLHGSADAEAVDKCAVVRKMADRAHTVFVKNRPDSAGAWRDYYNFVSDQIDEHCN